MKYIFLTLLILFSISSSAANIDYLLCDMTHKSGLGISAYKYSPSDARDSIGNKYDDWMISGYYYYFNTPDSSLEFGAGSWDESESGLSSKIKHITIGISFYNNLESNFKFFYGIDAGAFRLETHLKDNLGNINSYSKSDPGIQLKLGLAYLFNADLWMKSEIRYTGCTIKNILPTGDSNISDTNFALSLIAFF